MWGSAKATNLCGFGGAEADFFSFQLVDIRHFLSHNHKGRGGPHTKRSRAIKSSDFPSSYVDFLAEPSPKSGSTSKSQLHTPASSQHHSDRTFLLLKLFRFYLSYIPAGDCDLCYKPETKLCLLLCSLPNSDPSL
jgi:hypothetical protein